jgi:hypothetical protein
MRSRWLRFFIKQYFFKKLFLDGHFGYDMACGMAPSTNQEISQRK